MRIANENENSTCTVQPDDHKEPWHGIAWHGMVTLHWLMNCVMHSEFKSLSTPNGYIFRNILLRPQEKREKREKKRKKTKTKTKRELNAQCFNARYETEL